MILLLTHRADLRTHLTTTLREKGWTVCSAEHRQDVPQLIEECRPTILILDLYMADPSGLEMLRTVRAAGYRGKIILLSGHSMAHVIGAAYPHGVDRVVSVPDASCGSFGLGELEAAIQSCTKTFV